MAAFAKERNWLFWCFFLPLVLPKFCSMLHPVTGLEEQAWVNNTTPDNNSQSKPALGINAVPNREKTVRCYIQPYDIPDISLKEREFHVYTKVFIGWTDDNVDSPEIRQGQVRTLRKEEGRWHPNVIINDCEEYRNCALIQPQKSGPEGEIRATRSHDHTELNVHYVKSFLMSCKFDLTKYPFDVQLCSMRVMLLGTLICDKDDVDEAKSNETGFTESKCEMEAEKSLRLKLETNTNNKIGVPPGYIFEELTVTNCGNGKSHINGRMVKACFAINFEFRRIFSFSFLEFYLMSTMLTVISWFSFFFKPELQFTRLSLGMTAFMYISIHWRIVQHDLPSNDVIMAIDIWHLICVLMSFFNMMEYCVVAFCSGPQLPVGKQDMKQQCYMSKSKSSSSSDDQEALVPPDEVSFALSQMLQSLDYTHPIDYSARFLFPLTFIAFCAWYVIHYCY